VDVIENKQWVQEQVNYEGELRVEIEIPQHGEPEVECDLME